MRSSLPIPSPVPWTVSNLCPRPSMLKATLLNSPVSDHMLTLFLCVPPATCFPRSALWCLSHNPKIVFSRLSIYRWRTREGGAVWERLRGVGRTRMCLCPSDCHSLRFLRSSLWLLGKENVGKRPWPCWEPKSSVFITHEVPHPGGMLLRVPPAYAPCLVCFPDMPPSF